MNCPQCASRHIVTYPVTIERPHEQLETEWVRCADCGLSEQARP